jgi:hypothetical protein
LASIKRHINTPLDPDQPHKKERKLSNVGACCLTLLYRPMTEIIHKRLSWKKGKFLLTFDED